MATLDLQLDERMALEARKAILKAVKCPGKTHNMIKNKVLRDEFARELNDWRNQRNRAIRNGLGYLSQQEWKMLRAGLESAFWAMQKAENRAFIYGEQRLYWQLTKTESSRTPAEQERYEQYEAAVVATRMKVLGILSEIDAEFEAGKIDETQKSRNQ